MAKVYSYSVMLIGLILLLNMAGFPTATFQFFNAMFNGGATSEMYIAVIAVFALTIGGIAVSFFTRQSTESFIVAGLSSALFTWIFLDLISIYTVTATLGYPDFINDLIKLVLFPVTAGYAIAIIQWWRGNDI